MSDRASRKQAPERRCIVSGTTEPKRALIRFVIGPEGQAVPDLTGKLPGRGMYVCGDRDKLAQAVQKRAFSRSAKAPVQADAGLVDQTYQLVRRRVLDLLGLARRSGALMVGFEQVHKAAHGTVHVLITAQDASDDGARKILSRVAQGSAVVPHVAVFDRTELSTALGLPNAVHAAVVGSKNYGPEAVRNLKIAVDWLIGLAPQPQRTDATADERTDVSPAVAGTGQEE